MGVDWGRKRLGLAISDRLMFLAHPLTTHMRGSFRVDAQALREHMTTHEIVGVVVGLPSGENSVAPSIQSWAHRLHSYLSCPMTFHNEDFSSHEATCLAHVTSHHTLHDDAWAAAVMLQSFLESTRLLR